MSEPNRELKFTIYVERKVQVRPYESATVGLSKEFYQDEISEGYAFQELKSLVDVMVEEMRNSTRQEMSRTP